MTKTHTDIAVIIFLWYTPRNPMNNCTKLYRKEIFHMIELNHLEQLIAVAEAGTLSKAAEIIHISQPALTRSIQKLEDEWKISLFNRKK